MKKESAIEAEIVEENQVVLKKIKYPVGINDINTLLADYKDIPTIDPENEDIDLIGTQYQFVTKGHKAFVKVRNQIEKTRKELKAPSLEYGKKVDEIAKEFQALIKPIEDKLFIQRKLVEDNEDRKQREAEEAEELRIKEIKDKILNVKNLPLQHFNSNAEDITKALESLVVVSVDVYDEFYDEAVENQNYVISQLQTARDNKILVENAQKIQDEKDAEAKRLKDEEDEKLKREREEFQKEKDDFEEEKRKAESDKQLEEEAEELKAAELEADELLKKQADERKENEDNKLGIYNETLNKFEAYDNAKDLLDSIIEGIEFPHIKWEQ